MAFESAVSTSGGHLSCRELPGIPKANDREIWRWAGSAISAQYRSTVIVHLVPKLHVGQLRLDLPCNPVFPCDQFCFLSYPSTNTDHKGTVINTLCQTPFSWRTRPNTWNEWYTLFLWDPSHSYLRFWNERGSMMRKKLMEVEEFQKNHRYIGQDNKD